MKFISSQRLIFRDAKKTFKISNFKKKSNFLRKQDFQLISFLPRL